MRHLIPAAIAAAALTLAAGCSTTTTLHPHKAGHTQAAVAVAPSCATQLTTWRNDGAAARVSAIGTDAQASAAAGAAGNLGALQGAVTKLSTDAQTALASPPPACVPQMRADYDTAMNDFVAAADSVNQGSTGGLQDAIQQMDAGNAALVRAIQDLKQFERSSGLVG